MFNRRHFLHHLTTGLGAVALTELLRGDSTAGAAPPRIGGLPELPHFPAKAKRVICLFMSGGMTQFESFDHKPELTKRNGQELPDSYKQGRQKLLGMSGNQAQFPLIGSALPFQQYGQSGAWVSDGFKHIGAMADDICFIKSMKTDAVNHDPAMTFAHTGAQLPGRPSMGAWLNYGLGVDNDSLPAFIVMISRHGIDQPLSSRLWDAGFLPSQYQGVQFRAGAEPVLNLNSPPGLTPASTHRMLNAYSSVEKLKVSTGLATEAEIAARLAQYELAFRMQTAVPEVTQVNGEPDHIFDLYGPDSKTPGTFASNCLLARRLAEKGVRFIQLYHPGWDMHGHIVRDMAHQSAEVDQPAAALLRDLKDRGMLQDTLVIFTTEFGRTCYSQGRIRGNPPEFGREHHRDSFCTWMAGGGIKGGTSYGSTDELGFSIASDPVHTNDFHATLLHLLGIDHERFTFRFQGRDYRLTDLAGKVARSILA